MISKKLAEKINDQITKELESSYLYLAMSCDCAGRSLLGFAAWLRKQSEEEYEHAMKFLQYLEDQQAKVELEALRKPPSKFESVQKIFDGVLAHEKGVTKSINEIYKIAQSEDDFASQAFLNWFVTEQIEEEASAALIVDKLGMIGSSAGSLLYLDKEMGKRAKEKKEEGV